MKISKNIVPFAIVQSKQGTRVQMIKKWLSNDECRLLIHALNQLLTEPLPLNLASGDHDGVIVSGRDGLPVLPRQGQACDTP